MRSLGKFCIELAAFSLVIATLFLGVYVGGGP